MKLTKNQLRNVMAYFLTLRDCAKEEGLKQNEDWADKQYRAYRELYMGIVENEKRPIGVGADKPFMTFKIIIKSRLPLFEGNCNGKCG
ncbi:hypothetical protein [Paenibacillus rhizophilus]|uniref:Uncharacterized protein n=1 Tax=Paenibacillus rhizophilus TaxID=1850366 RepID=A0A3N9P169_9BACL|nr:hypothetical protein [Paenibacillus rhizophilus]RQW09933.1 hypothetical protein EH198_17790 [Paenibacillus rhizophilus]